MRIVHFALALTLAGCNSGGSGYTPIPDGGGASPDLAQTGIPDLASSSPDMARPPLGMPITAPKNTWTWVDFADSACDDGTPTGIGVRLTDSKNLVVFLNGGGACWDYNTCALLNTSAHGPFGAAQFAQFTKQNLSDSIFSTDPASPIADWNMVFIPYCTGDVHSGDNVVTYMGQNGATKKIFHKGHANILAFFKRLAATVPSPDNLIISGSSAGGFGAAINYDTARQFWPGGKGYLVDDSGPTLVGDAISPTLRMAWFTNWNTASSLGGLCPSCGDDFSAFLPILASRYPNDRLALLSTEQDKVIRTYFGLTPDAFKTDLYALVAMRLDPLPRFKYFIETGETHTMLGNISAHTSAGTPLGPWLKQLVTDDPQWKSVKP